MAHPVTAVSPGTLLRDPLEAETTWNFAMDFFPGSARLGSMTNPRWLLSCGIGLMLICLTVSTHGQATGADPDAASGSLSAPWPRSFTVEGLEYKIYQPQVESWDGRTLNVLAAVEVGAPGADDAKKGTNDQPQPVYGTIGLSAVTEVDKTNRTVTLQNISLEEINFPTAQDRQATFVQALRSQAASTTKTMSLDQLEASLAIAAAKRKTAGDPLNNQPPEFIFRTNPSMLVLISGNPVFTPVPGTNLQRVVNTHALILKDDADTLYLHLFDGWMSADSLNGKWKVAVDPPSELEKAKDAAVSAKQVDLLAGQPNPDTGKLPSLKTDPVPAIIMATEPAELIVTEGDPKWVTLQGLPLEYASNTISDFFHDTGNDTYYLLVTGRWFEAADYTQGPWQYVSPKELPEVFSQIPVDSPKENVLASVPGTPQSSEAYIANSIPQTSAIKLSGTQPNTPIDYAGNPELAPINGTGLQYVRNSQTPVIRVSDKAWYALVDGIWFQANSAEGPWSVAMEVPEAIYTIPPASPLYYVTFVSVYENADDNAVTVNVYPGYYGAIPASDGTVVFGTGYDYEDYVDDGAYIGYPVTYGYGSNLYWTPWAGWYMGFGAAMAWSNNWRYWNYAPVAPYWGGYRGATYGWHYRAGGGIRAWGPYGWAGASGHYWVGHGPRSGVTSTVGGYNPWTGNAAGARYRYSYNSRTGASNAVYRTGAANAYTGNYAGASAGARVNPRRGAVATGEKATVGNAYTGRQATAGEATRVTASGKVQHVEGVKTDRGGAIKTNNNVYAGHDGNVYRRESAGDWNHLNGGNRQVDDRLNRNFEARSLGGDRRHAFEGARRGGFGGGLRGGGFRGRR